MLKKIGFISLLLIFIIILTSCNLKPSKDWYKTMNMVLGFELPSSTSKRIEHGELNWLEIEVFDVWDLSKNAPAEEELEALNQWHRFPIPDKYITQFNGTGGGMVFLIRSLVLVRTQNINSLQ